MYNADIQHFVGIYKLFYKFQFYTSLLTKLFTFRLRKFY